MQARTPKEQFEDEKSAVDAYLQENVDRVKAWQKTNPGQRPPVYYLQEKGIVVWLTRSQRRKAARAEAKDQRREQERRRAQQDSFANLNSPSYLEAGQNQASVEFAPPKEVVDEDPVATPHMDSSSVLPDSGDGVDGRVGGQ